MQALRLARNSARVQITSEAVALVGQLQDIVEGNEDSNADFADALSVHVASPASVRRASAPEPTLPSKLTNAPQKLMTDNNPSSTRRACAPSEAPSPLPNNKPTPPAYHRSVPTLNNNSPLTSVSSPPLPPPRQNRRESTPETTTNTAKLYSRSFEGVSPKYPVPKTPPFTRRKTFDSEPSIPSNTAASSTYICYIIHE